MPRPDDECPYPKPFPAEFNACAAYQARQFIPLDTMYQPLEPVLTCRHLVTRALPQRHRWYAGCSIGDAEARRRWANEVGVARLERIRTIQRELGADIDMPVDAALRLITVAVDRFIDTKFATEVSFEVPDDVLRRFPEPVRTFFDPASAEPPRPNS